MCENCGRELREQAACDYCYGEDPYGQPYFCPECYFCCGC